MSLTGRRGMTCNHVDRPVAELLPTSSSFVSASTASSRRRTSSRRASSRAQWCRNSHAARPVPNRSGPAEFRQGACLSSAAAQSLARRPFGRGCNSGIPSRRWTPFSRDISPVSSPRRPFGASRRHQVSRCVLRQNESVAADVMGIKAEVTAPAASSGFSSTPSPVPARRRWPGRSARSQGCHGTPSTMRSVGCPDG